MMKGITLLANKKAKQLSATVDPLLFEGVLEPEALERYVLSTEHNSYFMLPNAIAALCEKANSAKSSDNLDEQTMVIGEIRDASLSVTIADDQMSAELIMESPYAGKVPSYENILKLLHHLNILYPHLLAQFHIKQSLYDRYPILQHLLCRLQNLHH